MGRREVEGESTGEEIDIGVMGGEIVFISVLFFVFLIFSFSVLNILSIQFQELLYVMV